jgi:hypothetical protein
MAAMEERKGKIEGETQNRKLWKITQCPPVTFA